MIVRMVHIGADHNLSEEDDAEDVIATVGINTNYTSLYLLHMLTSQ